MKNNQGSVVIYIVLLIVVMMTSSAIVLSTILSKHVRASENYLSSEQAFAGANSSIEHMLYQISKQSVVGSVTSEGIIDYGSGATVAFKGTGCGANESGQLVPHLTASGIYKSVVRRIDFGGGKVKCP